MEIYQPEKAASFKSSSKALSRNALCHANLCLRDRQRARTVLRTLSSSTSRDACEICTKHSVMMTDTRLLCVTEDQSEALHQSL